MAAAQDPFWNLAVGTTHSLLTIAVWEASKRITPLLSRLPRLRVRIWVEPRRRPEVTEAF